ncbi:MAG: hypothetical protein IID46_12945 [Planctomycetes bacterium]|nr:hypothetical protein [Planctomycetota bacterium]
MYQFLKNLDKRWVFLLMMAAVLIPVLLELRFPEDPSPMVRDVFQVIEDLPEGSKILMAMDYDPGTLAELDPMAAGFTRQCAKKKHKLFFITLLPQGGMMIQRNINILKREFPEYEYGRDYVNLGYRPGNDGVVKVVVSDLQELYGNDVPGTALDDIPMTKNMKNIQSIDLIISVSGSDPGTKQWVQFASTPYEIKTVAGVTGVQAPPLYAYIPHQMVGLLGAIKGAAEYEQVLLEHYPEFRKNKNTQEGLRRMGPQLVAHLLMIALIVLANFIFFIGRSRGEV